MQADGNISQAAQVDFCITHSHILIWPALCTAPLPAIYPPLAPLKQLSLVLGILIILLIDEALAYFAGTLPIKKGQEGAERGREGWGDGQSRLLNALQDLRQQKSA